MNAQYSMAASITGAEREKLIVAVPESKEILKPQSKKFLQLVVAVAVGTAIGMCRRLPL